MRLTSLIALLALMVFPVFAAMAQTPAAKADQASIARWIRDLADGDFEAREKASNSLWKAGNAAEKALQEAAKSDDLEVKKRAQEILQKFANPADRQFSANCWWRAKPVWQQCCLWRETNQKSPAWR